MSEIISFTKYQPKRKTTLDGEDKKYTNPEDDPKCKFNGEYVVADCYCKYADYYNQNKEKYNFSQNQLNHYDRYCWKQVSNFTDDKHCSNVDKTNLGIDCYCKYPDAYKNRFFGLSDADITRMDAACKSRAEAEQRSRRPKGFGEFTKGAAMKTADKIGLVVSGMFTPSGLQNFAEFAGVTVLPRIMIKKALSVFIETSNALKRGITEVSEFAVEEGGELVGEALIEGLAATSIAAMTEVIGESMSMATVAALSLSLDLGILAAEAMTGPLALVFVVFDVIMMAGMALDLLAGKFYGYDQQLSAKQLVDISDSYNQIFMKVVLSHLKLPEGATWPAEFFADSIIKKIEVSKEKELQFKGIQVFYSMQYLQSLTFNSRGEFIYHPYAHQPNTTIITKDNINTAINKLQVKNNLQSIENSLLYLYSNDNTSVVIFLKRNWFLLLIIILVIIIFIVFIK